MRHLQALAENFSFVVEVNQLLRSKILDKGILALRVIPNANGLANDTPAAKEFTVLKERARGLMLLVGGSQLGQVHVARIDAKSKLSLGVSNPEIYRFYIAVLYAKQGCMVMAEDDGADILGGQYWWVEVGELSQIINNSDDDCIVMMVEVRLDE